MRGLGRVLFIALLMVALPVRAIAAVTVDSCLSHGDTANGAQAAAMHDAGAEHHGQPAADDASGSAGADDATVCSDCASCCVGASLATWADTLFPAQPNGSAPIPFLDTPAEGRAPGALDRPPLAS